MKTKIISTLLAIFLLFSVFCLPSCSRNMPSTKDILIAMTAAEVGLPSGRVYLSSAEPGSENYTPPALLASLYGGGSAPIEQSEWVEFAIFLPTAQHPCELAVFLCQSDQSASDTAKMLCLRYGKNALPSAGCFENGMVENSILILR